MFKIKSVSGCWVRNKKRDFSQSKISIFCEGLNGAGKTTTFKILTGEIHATSGNAFINGFDINKDRFSARRNLGFCPQYDYLPEFLTVHQTLILFSRLRGLEPKLLLQTVKEMINIFKLNEFSNKFVQNLR